MLTHTDQDSSIDPDSSHMKATSLQGHQFPESLWKCGRERAFSPAFTQTTSLCACLACLCVHGSAVFWIIRAPVPSLLAYSLPCFCHPSRSLNPSPQGMVLILLLPTQKSSDFLLRCWHPKLSLGPGIKYSRSVSKASKMHAKCRVLLALNLAVHLFSCSTNEGSKDLCSDLLRVSGGVWATQLLSAETEAWGRLGGSFG